MDWKWSTEPARIIRLIEAAILMFVGLGAIMLTDAQTALIIVFATALVELFVGAKVTRDSVWSPASHDRKLLEVEQAVQEGPPEDYETFLASGGSPDPDEL